MGEGSPLKTAIIISTIKNVSAACCSATFDNRNQSGITLLGSSDSYLQK